MLTKCPFILAEFLTAQAQSRPIAFRLACTEEPYTNVGGRTGVGIDWEFTVTISSSLSDALFSSSALSLEEALRRERRDFGPRRRVVHFWLTSLLA